MFIQPAASAAPTHRPSRPARALTHSIPTAIPDKKIPAFGIVHWTVWLRRKIGAAQQCRRLSQVEKPFGLLERRLVATKEEAQATPDAMPPRSVAEPAAVVVDVQPAGALSDAAGARYLVLASAF